MSISKRMHLLYRIYCTIRLMNLNFEYSDGSQFAVLFPQCFTSMTCCSKPVIQSSRSFRVKFIFGSLKIHLRGKICLLSVSSVPVRPGIPNAEKQRSHEHEVFLFAISSFWLVIDAPRNSNFLLLRRVSPPADWGRKKVWDGREELPR